MRLPKVGEEGWQAYFSTTAVRAGWYDCEILATDVAEYDGWRVRTGRIVVSIEAPSETESGAWQVKPQDFRRKPQQTDKACGQSFEQIMGWLKQEQRA